jgi:hypothetical protein
MSTTVQPLAAASSRPLSSRPVLAVPYFFTQCSRSRHMADTHLCEGWASHNMQPNETKVAHPHGMAARFVVLKTRLLLECLNQTPESETHALIMRQANEAALLAWLSSYPLLTFPCLFEEKVASVTEQARRQACVYWNGLGAETPARAAQPAGEFTRIPRYLTSM